MAEVLNQAPCKLSITTVSQKWSGVEAQFCLALLNGSIFCHIIEQDHRDIKRIVKLMLGSQPFHTAKKMLDGIEAITLIYKGQAERISQRDGVSQARFSNEIFGGLEAIRTKPIRLLLKNLCDRIVLFSSTNV